MNAWNFTLAFWCAVLSSVIGCGPAEPQVTPPREEPAPEPAPAVEDAKPQAAVEPGPKRQAVDVENAEPRAVVRDEAVKQAQFEEPAKEGDPRRRTAFYRLDASGPAKIPPVMFSKNHEALCKVKVGDAMPAIELMPIGSSQPTRLADQFGKSATVIVFWKGDRRMARDELADLGPDVVELFGERGVAVVGVAVNETPASAKAALDKAGAQFVNLLDADGKAFALVGRGKLPRTYLVDPQGKILWFDIEYSPSTRRELHQALHAATGAPPETPADVAEPPAANARE